MYSKPFKNSKGVNKPFRSPFLSTPQHNHKNDLNIDEQNKHQTPLNRKANIGKRLIFEQTPSPKKQRIETENENNLENGEEKKELYTEDLKLLRKRIKQKESIIRDLKTSILYRKKNKAEDMECAIEMWTAGCRNVLIDYQNKLQKDHGQTINMIEILSTFNIKPDLVNFSTEDNTFH